MNVFNKLFIFAVLTYPHSEGRKGDLPLERAECGLIMAESLAADPTRIAVIGSMEADRHYICNAILGEELLHKTEDIVEVQSWNDEKNEIFIEVISIATFDDSCHDAEKYGESLKGIQDKKFDLVLYCLPGKSDQPDVEEDKNAYRQLVLHEIDMNNCIVVLTFADSIVKYCQTRRNTQSIRGRVVKDYKMAIIKWTDSIRPIFGEKTPLIPAGSLESFSILDNGESWLQNLFECIIEKSNNKTSSTLIRKNCHRFYTGYVSKKFLIGRKIIDHPIVVASDNSKIKAKIREISAGLGVGGATGAVGATIGALIGALAIGIPSFGVAAGIGLILGAAIGGGIGVGSGVGFTKVVEKLNRKKYDDEDDEGLI